VHLKVLKRLLDAGISLKSARRAVDYLRSAGADLGSANLVIDEGRTVLARTGEEIVDLVKGGQGVLNIVAMEPLVSEVDAAVMGLKEAVAATRDAKGAGATQRRLAAGD